MTHHHALHASPDAPEARDTSSLRIAVVGHTNTGKTSLLRTLTRDQTFGTVEDRPGTTRQVEGARLLVDGKPVMSLFDTPGMEDGVSLMDYLESQAQPGQRQDGPERIRQFLQSPESSRRFEQEARVLRKLLECDAGLYVVDVRDPVLGKHKDELAVLALCGHPLLPVLNFVRSPQARTAQWRDTLARLGLHASVDFDTIAPALDGEAQLYDKLALLLDRHATALHLLKDDITQQRRLRRKQAARLIAGLLIDAAAWRVPSAPDLAALDQAAATLRDAMREREQRCVRDLLQCYQFNPQDFPYDALPVQGERWAMDLFHPQALKDMGIHLSKGIAAGAMAGATLDMATAGLSLGTGTLLGAAAGGLWQGMDRWGKRLAGRLKGYRELTIDDAVLRLLALRQLALVRALEQRGHAAQTPIRLPETAPAPSATAAQHAVTDTTPQQATSVATDTIWRGKALPEELVAARGRPQWSQMAQDFAPDAERERATEHLAARLVTH